MLANFGLVVVGSDVEAYRSAEEIEVMYEIGVVVVYVAVVVELVADGRERRVAENAEVVRELEEVVVWVVQVLLSVLLYRLRLARSLDRPEEAGPGLVL